jgi:hypothetical protein
MWWSTREGQCPLVRPTLPNPKKPEEKKITTVEKPISVSKNLLENKENMTTVVEQPASGIINSTNAFSAIRSTTTLGSKSAITSTLNGGLTTNTLPRSIQTLQTKLTESPAPKKRKISTTLLQQSKRKKEVKLSYCENCKEEYENYDDVPPFLIKLIIAYFFQTTSKIC